MKRSHRNRNCPCGCGGGGGGVLVNGISPGDKENVRQGYGGGAGELVDIWHKGQRPTDPGIECNFNINITRAYKVAIIILHLGRSNQPILDNEKLNIKEISFRTNWTSIIPHN